MRIGHGFDVHKFGGRGPIVLGGVDIPYEHGFIAHSDGDVAIHALCDAILGALCLADIGNHFPDTDGQYENISSRILLRHVVGLMNEKGYHAGSLFYSLKLILKKYHNVICENNQANFTNEYRTTKHSGQPNCRYWRYQYSLGSGSFHARHRYA
jgi:2-C-methyl-D-erythritol 2,4-cyclodiphosphate synthase